MEKILNTTKDFNINKFLDHNLSMALGAGLTTLQDLTNAYAMIVNGGKKIIPTLIISVNDKSGKLIINNENKILLCIVLLYRGFFDAIFTKTKHHILQ